MRSWIWMLLVMTACSSGKVITYAHPNADFGSYRTYRIASHKKIAEISEEGYASYQRLDEVIARLLESKGYRPQLDSDLLVEYKVSAGLSQDTRNNYYDRYSWYYPNYSYFGGPRQAVEGMLEIQLLDARRKKPVWTGSADLILKTRGKDNEELIKRHIEEILERFQYSAPD